MHHSLHTDRLTLKNIDHSDTEFIYEMFSNDFINQYLFDAEPLTSLDEAKDLVDFYTYYPNDMNHRYIIINQDGLKIGTVGFHNFNKETQSIDIGYDLKEAYNHQGYMQEALHAVIDYLENTCEVKEIHACIYIDNERSMNLVRKLGFKEQGTKQEWFRNQAFEHLIFTRKLALKTAENS